MKELGVFSGVLCTLWHQVRYFPVVFGGGGETVEFLQDFFWKHGVFARLSNFSDFWGVFCARAGREPPSHGEMKGHEGE